MPSDERNDPPSDWEARLEKQWGPPISPLRRWLSATFIVVALVGLVVLAFLSVPG